MKKLIFYFLILALAVWLGVYMHNHPSFVLISIGSYRIEMTLWLAILALLLFLILLRLVIKFVRSIMNAPNAYKEWADQRRSKKSQSKMKSGFFELIKEDWVEAEKQMLSAAQKGRDKILGYMGAAAAAQGQKDIEQRDQYLENARNLADDQERKILIDIQKIRWQLANGEYQTALAQLETLKLSPTEYPYILKAKKDVYFALQDWTKLRSLLPQLRLYHSLNEKEMQELENILFRETVAEACVLNNKTKLEKAWNDLPSPLKKDNQFLALYSAALIQLHDSEKAEDLLKMRLRKNLDATLLQQYAAIDSSNPAKQLSRAEHWLEEYPKNAALLLCLGKLCMKLRLWGKAKTYLEAAAKIQPNPQVYLILGEVYEQLDEKNTALECYKKGLGTV